MCLPSADLEWKLTYVGSAESEKYDQELDSVLVGPVVRGQYRFIFQVGLPCSWQTFSVLIQQCQQIAVASMACWPNAEQSGV